MLLRVLLVAALLLAPGPASAVPKTYKHDQFNADIATAALEIAGDLSITTQPGWAQGEAFGQVFRPAASDYPVTILGMDLVLAAAPNAPGGSINGTIEFWTSASSGANPGTAAPVFALSTADIRDPETGLPGLPLRGDTATQIEFEWEDPNGHPPVNTEGNVWVMSA